MYNYIHVEFLIYDDGCHLKRYAQNPERSQQTETVKFISNLNIVIDKMHFKGHVDSWCKTHCNPYTFDILNNVIFEITWLYVHVLYIHINCLLPFLYVG